MANFKFKAVASSCSSSARSSGASGWKIGRLYWVTRASIAIRRFKVWVVRQLWWWELLRWSQESNVCQFGGVGAPGKLRRRVHYLSMVWRIESIGGDTYIRKRIKIGPLSRTARPVAQAKSSITTSAKLRLFATYKIYYSYNSSR